ncbi:SMI1/KNR4 family protein [Paenibacillus woosongensis]|uniref:SMI1/KNR4 family protein n=1 Tax=Paenibacillus woosongensis TaxID=307580 RepID=A0AA95KZT2_9BACL|nr:SMI1/KNR4 family protein [Paenibacillus woosongensis]WHX47199.1 SMI1/KNR4 family protein [Paenibacillus woosongensis]
MRRVEWLESDGPASEEQIQKVEKYLGVEFPKDYKECVTQFNGGYPEPDLFDINEEKDAIFSCLLSHTNDEASILEVYDLSSNVLPAEIIPFARDPFGNLICFDYRGKRIPTIIFFDHEEVGDKAIYQICSTFSELLERLYSIDD